ncbi:MAG TPA: GIY-YIG nuclease family protein [Xanthobacteraceae bacterium]|jgi:putative endonuclease|nr:GIY-YIG nuclease family protein [Xanthobacteraceae bacterium]
MGVFVYLLRCADGSFYTGSAIGDLSKRIAEHDAGTYPGYTSKRRPISLVWSQYFEQIPDALAAERQIKGWSRSKKQALIDSNWDALAYFAKRKNVRLKPNCG